jgi:hypothetical protein
VGENICWLCIKVLITRIYREHKKLNFSKINESIKKWATELSRTFSRMKSKWPKKKKKTMEKCSPSLATEEMQIKTTVRFHLTPVRIASRTPPPPNIGEDEGKTYTAGRNVS